MIVAHLKGCYLVLHKTLVLLTVCGCAHQLKGEKETITPLYYQGGDGGSAIYTAHNHAPIGACSHGLVQK